MLYSENLITNKSINSYNTAVKQINNDRKIDLQQLKKTYENQERAFENYKQLRYEVEQQMVLLRKKIAYLGKLTDAMR